MVYNFGFDSRNVFGLKRQTSPLEPSVVCFLIMLGKTILITGHCFFRRGFFLPALFFEF
jgi:hypothetical protein